MAAARGKVAAAALLAVITAIATVVFARSWQPAAAAECGGEAPEEVAAEDLALLVQDPVLTPVKVSSLRLCGRLVARRVDVLCALVPRMCGVFSPCAGFLSLAKPQ